MKISINGDLCRKCFWRHCQHYKDPNTSKETKEKGIFLCYPLIIHLICFMVFLSEHFLCVNIFPPRSTLLIPNFQRNHWIHNHQTYSKYHIGLVSFTFNCSFYFSFISGWKCGAYLFFSRIRKQECLRLGKSLTNLQHLELFLFNSIDLDSNFSCRTSMLLLINFPISFPIKLLSQWMKKM